MKSPIRNNHKLTAYPPIGSEKISKNSPSSATSLKAPLQLLVSPKSKTPAKRFNTTAIKKTTKARRTNLTKISAWPESVSRWRRSGKSTPRSRRFWRNFSDLFPESFSFAMNEAYDFGVGSVMNFLVINGVDRWASCRRGEVYAYWGMDITG